MTNIPTAFDSLPYLVVDFMDWSWMDIEPYYKELTTRNLTPHSIHEWLVHWSTLSNLVGERLVRLRIARMCNTADQKANIRYLDYLTTIWQSAKNVEHKLKEKLLISGLVPDGFEIPLRTIQASSVLFHSENLLLLTQEAKIANDFQSIIGSQTVGWQGETYTFPQLQSSVRGLDRAARKHAWRMIMERQLQDREQINTLWTEAITTRQQIAENVGLANYREYIWPKLGRFDYTPEDCRRFHEAIEQVAVPAATRIYEKAKQRLGVDTLRPWDLGPDMLYPISDTLVHHLGTMEKLYHTLAPILQRIDPEFGQYFKVLFSEQLLDLINRPNKATGGSCSPLRASKRAFIFMNSTGVYEDIQMIMHELGHAFHIFYSSHLPYAQQQEVGSEFSEVASITMEFLALPYLAVGEGGFYSDKDARDAVRTQLERAILLWPFVAVVDAFQHWVYENPNSARDSSQCDIKWAELYRHYIPGISWDGFEAEMQIGWHRKHHIHRKPFHYIEYGFAQLGAVQIWRNAMQNQTHAIQRYRHALSLGSTRTIPELYEAAGAKFDFEVDALQLAVKFIEQQLG